MLGNAIDCELVIIRNLYSILGDFVRDMVFTVAPDFIRCTSGNTFLLCSQLRNYIGSVGIYSAL